MISRRRFMSGATSPGALYAGGTFIGDGTNTAVLNIGFEPDVLVITSSLDFTTPGWAGVGDIVFVKGICTYVKRHNNDTATTPTANSNNTPGITGGDYGTEETAGSYHAYGSYANGSFLVTNKSTGAGVNFYNDQIYTWQAFKAPGEAS